jgi:hypothetical protein
MRQDSSLIALVALVWLALAGLYAFVPMFSMPGSARVWGAGAVVFILLAGCLWLAERGARRREPVVDLTSREDPSP